MYKRYAVMIPPCMLSPGMQAVKNKGTDNNLWRKIYLTFFLQYDIDAIPFPCAESTFQGLANGLLRKPHGIDYYSNLDGYREHCDFLADLTMRQILAMEKSRYCFIAILGIEHSPSCAVNYMYSHTGMKKESGLFISALKKKLAEAGCDIPYVGINRRYPRKSMDILEKILTVHKIKIEEHESK